MFQPFVFLFRKTAVFEPGLLNTIIWRIHHKRDRAQGADDFRRYAWAAGSFFVRLWRVLWRVLC